MYECYQCTSVISVRVLSERLLRKFLGIKRVPQAGKYHSLSNSRPGNMAFVPKIIKKVQEDVQPSTSSASEGYVPVHV